MWNRIGFLHIFSIIPIIFCQAALLHATHFKTTFVLSLSSPSIIHDFLSRNNAHLLIVVLNILLASKSILETNLRYSYGFSPATSRSWYFHGTLWCNSVGINTNPRLGFVTSTILLWSGSILRKNLSFLEHLNIQYSNIKFIIKL